MKINLLEPDMQYLFTARNSRCGRVMFTQVFVSPPGGGSVHPLGKHAPPDRHLPWANTSPRQTPPSRRRLLQRMVRILLECILVYFNNFCAL